jgi:hypothetical protein
MNNQKLKTAYAITFCKDENGNVTMINKNLMKTIKIKVPDGYEIDTENSTFEQIVFKELKKELPKSWEELAEIEGYWVTPDSTVVYASQKTIFNHLIIFKTKKQAQASIALAQLSQLRDVYRQGWEPDWIDRNKKFCILKELNNFTIDNYEYLPHFLSFQSQEIAEEFLNNFKDLIEEASPLLFGD